MNAELAELFAGIAAEGEEILFMPNPGNAGDSLIAHATYAFFRQMGVRWVPASSQPGSGEGRVVVYGGGGNLVPGYDEARAFLEAHVGRCRRLVLMPHTVSGNQDLLSRFGPETHLFLREDASYSHCAESGTGAVTHRAHDMAFGLPLDAMRPVEWSELLLGWIAARRQGEGNLSRALRFVMVDRLRRGDARGRVRPKGCVLDAFRTDSESPGNPLPSGNRDLSKAFELGRMTPRWASLSARLMTTWIEGASLVRTDRLHVAIACCLKKVPVEIHANATHKVRAVFERSIRDRFARAIWCPDEPSSEARLDR